MIWGESIYVLFEQHCLPLLIRSDLIGKSYYVSMFVLFCFLFLFFPFFVLGSDAHFLIGKSYKV